MKTKEDIQKIHVLGQNESMQQVVQLVGGDSGYEDEINLFDLWFVLVKRRNLFLAIVLAFMVAGITFAVVKPVLHEYSAVLQVGVMVAGGNKEPKFIESPGNVLAKLTRSYIPLAQSEFLKKNPDIKSAPEITAKMASKSDLIILEARGEEKDSEMYLSIIQHVIRYIQKDHQPQMDIARNEYELLLQNEKVLLSELEDPVTLKMKQKPLEIELVQANLKVEGLKDQRLVRVVKQELVTLKKEYKNKLASLSDEHKRLSSERARLNDVDRLLEKRAAELSNTIKNVQKNRNLTAKSVGTGPEVMTVLLLDDQIQTNRDQLAEIEERLNYEQQSLREKLDNQIKANTRSQGYHQKLIQDVNSKLEKLDIENSHEQQEALVAQSGLKLNLVKMQLDHENSVLVQKQKIDGLAYKLKGLRDTQTLTEPMQSLKPVGTGKKLIVMMSFIAGLFVAVFAVFFLEFIAKAKERANQAQIG